MKTRLYKARIVFKPTDKACESLKAAGFDGLEAHTKDVTVDDAIRFRRLVEKHDLRIHSVFGGGARFDSPDPDVIDKGVESIRRAVRVASAYGADTVLLVPARADGLKVPDPWDFDIDFDPGTLEVKRVVDGDNAPYAEYIDVQNRTTRSTLRAVERLIPDAAREGVRIAIENVWNNLWCTPSYFAALVRRFDNPWIGAYFDLGNHLKYSRCELWLKELGSRVLKLHIKGFRVEEVKGKSGGGPGRWVKIDEASADWKSVRATIEEIGYNGWLTIEEDGYGDERYGKILDDFIAG